MAKYTEEKVELLILEFKKHLNLTAAEENEIRKYIEKKNKK